LRKNTERGEIALRQVKPYADAAVKAAADHANAAAKLKEAQEQESAAAAEVALVAALIAGLAPLEEAKQAYGQLEKEWEQASEKEKKLTALEKSRQNIASKQKNLVALQAEYETLAAGFAAAHDRFEALDSAFFAAQAGLLAHTLTAGQPCPVCGSTEHPRPAAPAGGEVSEDARKRAKKAADAARDKREAQAGACAKLAAETETLKTAVLAEAAPFIEAAAWEALAPALLKLLKEVKAAASELAARKLRDQKSLAALAGEWESAGKRKEKSDKAFSAATALAAERKANEKNLSELSDKTGRTYADALRENGFADERAYKAALTTEGILAANMKKITAYDNRGKELNRDIERLTAETAEKTAPDLDRLRARFAGVSSEYKALAEKRDGVKSRLDKTQAALTELRRAAVDLEKVEKSYAAVKQLAAVANGRLDFETYAQTSYFERVLRAANLRLKLMSQNRYALLRKEESDDKRSRTGLEIEVLDSYTGKARSANSLSGGESFMASLSLALGLSDVVQQSAGGIHLDAMFIDEGFGSLDAEVLELAVRTLSEMAGGNRIIGIISHVAELRERIDKQVQVEKTLAGSKIRLQAT
jgi:exonuclease SbcC